MTNHPSTADTCDLPTRRDVQELREAIESLRDHVQIVWQAIDEVREVIDRSIGPAAPDLWTVEPSQGFGLGRHRPFAWYEPFEESSAENQKPVEPSPDLKASAADEAPDAELPAELPSDVRSAVAACLQESQGQGGMDSLAGPHRRNTNDPQSIPVANGATQQRPLWREDATQPHPAASTANGVAEAAQAVTSQKEAEPGAGRFVRPDRVTNDGEALNNSAESVYFAPLAGHELTSLMHKHKVTIGELAKRTGITQKRIRQARENGLSNPNIVRDWLQAILGREPGPIGARPLSQPVQKL